LQDVKGLIAGNQGVSTTHKGNRPVAFNKPSAAPAVCPIAIHIDYVIRKRDIQSTAADIDVAVYTQAVVVYKHGPAVDGQVVQGSVGSQA